MSDYSDKVRVDGRGQPPARGASAALSELEIKKLFELMMVLNRLKDARVRSDFLDGKVVSSKNHEKTLRSFDAIHELFTPAWSPDAFLRTRNIDTLLHHYRLLLVADTSFFDIPSRHEDLLVLSYAVWNRAIQKLLESSYWQAVEPCIFEDPAPPLSTPSVSKQYFDRGANVGAFAMETDDDSIFRKSSVVLN